METCLQLDPANPLLVNERGVLLYELKQYEKAEEACVAVLRLIDGYEPAEKQAWVFVYLNLAHIYRRQGKVELAWRMLHKVETIGGPVAVGLVRRVHHRTRAGSSC